MTRMKIFNSLEKEAFESPPVFNSAERKKFLSVIFHDHSPTWFSNPFTQARRAELVR